ncbi:MAG: 2-oxoglutarate dehydrogenase E1 component [Desulfobacterales bacterium]|nr:2-oxoglutarate dehydrogenase E1 component [Desulfobacterales bacterium]
MSTDVPEALNADFIDAQYRQWKKAPDSLPRDWQYFFKGFEIGHAGGGSDIDTSDPAHSLLQASVQALIYRYRNIGHLLACMDPLTQCPTEHPFLELEAFDLSLDDLEKTFFTPQIPGVRKAPLKEIVKTLKETYCRSVGVEYMHLQDPTEQQWLQEKMEPVRNQLELDAGARRRILEKLSEAALFEEFLNKKYVGVTRFSLEGGDAVVPMLDTIVEQSAALGNREIILGMAHRGRLNVQAHTLNRPYGEIFSEFESCYDPDALTGSGDVKYHNGYLSDRVTVDGHPIRMFLVNNPSHLEAVDPVVQGIARGRQELVQDLERSTLPILIHGDAAFAGQGVVAEILNMSQLKGYQTGGTIHIVINNQIGYTTLPEDARSTRYSTDVAKMLMVPIFHVHGENPEAVVHVARLAAEYRHEFHKDVVIDVVCYRRYGHNEGDEPYFTQPLMYDRIRQREPLNRIYSRRLVEEKVVSADEVVRIEAVIAGKLEAAYDTVHGSECPFPENRYYENWDGFHGKYSHEPVKTAISRKRLGSLAKKLATLPPGFAVHRKIDKLLSNRRDAVVKGEGIDWANAEALAMASLLEEGHSVRLSGQDVGRGTFSQRHCVLTDPKTGSRFVPLNALGEGQAPFHVFNSLLAEVGVLGFEYGYSSVQPNCLTLWEAQFGDFANNAQGIIDLFIASGESKWERLSGLVMLLPHGWEGLGPEHSSARLERFLQLCAGDNMQVCHLTTPAQYFHLLRRQMKSDWRKPLVLMTPKSLLRHPQAVSTVTDFTAGSFREVLGDAPGFETARRVILCSGKLYYQLLLHREKAAVKDTAILRLEQFYPFPAQQLEKITSTYKKATQWLWVQEEPENMGGWQFVRHRLEKIIKKEVAYVGRKASSSPATGFPAIYRREQSAISDAAFGPVGADA